MQIGFNLPNSGPLSAVAAMTEIAAQGEAMGFDYLTLTDHVVLPDTKVPGHPYSESGAFYEEVPTEWHEKLIGMTWVATKAARIRLAAAVPLPIASPRRITHEQLNMTHGRLRASGLSSCRDQERPATDTL